MSHNFLFSSSFHAFLFTIDVEFINDDQKKGCCFCGGKLHRASYPRSPLGISPQQRHHYEKRLSLCCYTCRKRATPPSVRFFGRCRFPGAIFLFISLLTQSINQYRIEQLKRRLGVRISIRTWKRWRRWWCEQFIKSRFWLQAKGLIRTNASSLVYPRFFLSLFSGVLQEKMILLLQFLSPVTSEFLHAI